ncbi:hypothetical protein CPC08DRAFT_34765 [Agrocybe pediades]|nr:hypothetical protein CPC08DRAFT_34765 [Agrocybe pediades]
MKTSASLGKNLDVSAITLEDLRLQKEKLEEERAVLLSRLEETETKIIAVQAEYGAVYNKATKLLKLPPEVTCMIFTCAAAGYSRERKKWGEKARSGAVPLLPEVVVSHVCRYWRAVSLSYPRLWTSFRYNGACHELSPVDRFKAYLERSANLDLKLWIDFSLVIMEEDRAINLSMLQLAVAHAQRWNRVTLMLDPESKILPEITRRLKALHVPKLEHFALCSEGDEIDLGRRNSNRVPLVDLKTTIFKSGAPRLSSVHLDGATYIKCSPPMANITALRIEPDVVAAPRQVYNGKAILSILRLPSLEHLSLVGVLFELQDISSLHTIEMNKLKSLRFSDHDAMCLLLAYIRAPLLDMLTIQSVCLPAEFGTLTSFGREPYFFPSLNRLNVLDVSVTTSLGAEFLISLTQTAKEIMFAQDDYEDGILLLIPEIYSDHPFWPKLEQLSVNMDVEDEMDSILHLISMDGRPQTKLTLFVPSSIKKTWKSTEEDYDMLVCLCDIKVLQPKGFGASTWPPSQDQSNYQFWWEQDDPFEIDEI